MGHLPIPASVFFQDFAFDVLDYTVLEDGQEIAVYRGLTNSDEMGEYIGFLVSDHPCISIGSILCTAMGAEYTIRKISYDHYNGEPELFKAYY